MVAWAQINGCDGPAGATQALALAHCGAIIRSVVSDSSLYLCLSRMPPRFTPLSSTLPSLALPRLASSFPGFPTPSSLRLTAALPRACLRPTTSHLLHPLLVARGNSVIGVTQLHRSYLGEAQSCTAPKAASHTTEGGVDETKDVEGNAAESPQGPRARGQSGDQNRVIYNPLVELMGWACRAPTLPPLCLPLLSGV
ncbi:hypothetical protein CYMTET_34188 [Cymbomonas tetramitiformis]|uniref:Uncharacterized protein n=1 Tax=Cymbomonas tetramitiformis TaxID=36881 RepID=A0AAE0FC59_9CHLO|nr:hypothetical protein CYMTET_34188 [Cymbomonas tetramitiformis]